MELPSRFTQAWIKRTFPTLSPPETETALEAMRRKGWTEEDLSQRVYPHLAKPGADNTEAKVPSLPDALTVAWVDEVLPTLTLSQAIELTELVSSLDPSAPDEVTLALTRHLTAKLDPEGAEEVLKGLGTRGVSDEEIEVLAPALAGPGPSEAAQEESGLESVSFPCPRGHWTASALGFGYHELICPDCEADKKAVPRFLVAFGVTCRGVERRAITRKIEEIGWRRTYHRSERVGTSYRVTYANPEPPPPQRRIRFAHSAVDEIHLRSGQMFSFVLGEPGRWRKKGARVTHVYSHELEQWWAVE